MFETGYIPQAHSAVGWISPVDKSSALTGNQTRIALAKSTKAPTLPRWQQ
jgi:hypothetical protein